MINQYFSIGGGSPRCIFVANEPTFDESQRATNEGSHEDGVAFINGWDCEKSFIFFPVDSGEAKGKQV